MENRQYSVTGMSCAACSQRVEKAVGKLEGVTQCSVNLLTNSMVVESGLSDEVIIEAVENAGYHAERKDNLKSENVSGNKAVKTVSMQKKEEELLEKESPILKKRFLISLVLLAPLMYLSMGVVMFHWKVPSFFEGNGVGLGLAQLILTVLVMLVNQSFFIRGLKGLLHKAPNMDTLVAMGSMASFIYSVVVLFGMTKSQSLSETEAVMEGLHGLYFESAAMILTLITMGKMMEARAKGKTTDALRGLMKLAPKTAVVLQNGVEVEIPAEEVTIGDIFVVRPGESIPVDGIVIEGASAVNEAALTGESVPVDKEKDDKVYAATMNQSGFLKCEAVKVGEDTTLARIIQMVSDAAATKAPIAKLADQVSGVFVPVVIVLAFITTFVWLLIGESIGFCLARGVSVLVISCPCALGLATPVAIMVGNGVAAKRGILFKTAVSLEETGKADTVVLDKTGTVTTGEVWVTDVMTEQGVTEFSLLETAYLLEKKSEHPLAGAVVRWVQEEMFIKNPQWKTKLLSKELTKFQVSVGNGLTGESDGERLIGGKLSFIEKEFGAKKMQLSEQTKRFAKEYAKQGKTPLYFCKDGQVLGMIAVSDKIKEDSQDAVKELQSMGCKVVMLTGDNQVTANAVGEKAGVDEVIAEVMPDGKEKVIRELQKTGKVIMVGDGINDAPALTAADVGIAVGAGTDIAMDAADVILVKNSLMDVVYALQLSRKTRKNICENLFWAFIYNIIGIPLAAGVWIPFTGWELNPMFAAAAMSLSSFCVVSNALRLNWFQPKLKYVVAGSKINSMQTSQSSHGEVERQLKPKNTEIKEKESQNMEKTMEIKGMMCAHCEARVKKCLEGIDGVTEAIVSHESDSAKVILAKEISDDVLKKAVEDQDYEVISIS